MAIPSTQVWEVNASGVDTNGGGFDPSLGTNDYTYPNSVPISYSDLAAANFVGTPATPTVTPTTGGSMAVGTYKTKITYTTVSGETLPSTLTSATTVSGTQELVVTSPAATGGATGYNVYITAAGGSTHYLQNGGTPVAIGVNYTQASAPVTTTAQPPVLSTSNLIVASVNRPFVAADIGNTLNITGGTGFIPGRYSVRALYGGNQAVLDRNMISASGSGGTGKLGGALLTVQAGLAALGTSQLCWVSDNGASYSNGGAAFVSSAAGPILTNTVTYTRLFGYGTVRGDAGRPLLSGSTASSCVLQFQNDASYVKNIRITGNSTATTGISVARFSIVDNCLVQNCGFGAIFPGAQSVVQYCECTGCNPTSGVGIIDSGNSASVRILFNFVHDCSMPTGYAAIRSNGGLATIVGNVIARCSVGYGISLFEGFVLNNTVFSSGADGIYISDFSSYNFGNLYLSGNIMANCGGYGLNAVAAFLETNSLSTQASGASAPLSFGPWAGNAYYANTSGARSANAGFTSGDAGDIILTASPFVNPATNDFRLNGTLGAGSAIRGVRQPAFIAGAPLTRNYADFGAVQNGNTLVFS